MTAVEFPPLQNDLILRTARGEKVERTPTWVMRQAGRYLPEYKKEKGDKDFFECCRDPETASNLTVQPIDRYFPYVDAAIIFSDILVIPQAVGMDVQMDPGSGPKFPEPMRTPEDHQYEEILARDVDVTKELDYVYKAITMTRLKLKGRVPLFGFTGAPWTLLCYMTEGEGSKMFRHIKKWVYEYPEQSKKMLQKITDVCIDYLAHQVGAGAQILQVFDSWAGELPPSKFREFSLPYLKQIADKLPAKLKAMNLQPVPLTVFAKGAWYALEDLCQTNYDTVGLDWLHDPAEAYKITQKYGKVVQGNLDPGILYGTPEAIEQGVKDMVKGFGGGKQGWIANLGHGVTPFVDPEHLRVFYESVYKYSKL